MSAPNFIRVTKESTTSPILVNINTVRSVSRERGGKARLNYIPFGDSLGGHLDVEESFDTVVNLITALSLGRFSRSGSVDPS